MLFSLVLLWTWNLGLAIWVQNVSQLQLQTKNQRPCEVEILLIQFSSEFRNLNFFCTHIYDSDWSFFFVFFFMGATSEARCLEGTLVFTLTLSFILEKSITDPETMAGVKPETATHEVSLIVNTNIPWEGYRGCSLYCMCIKFKWRVRNGYKTQKSFIGEILACRDSSPSTQQVHISTGSDTHSSDFFLNFNFLATFLLKQIVKIEQDLEERAGHNYYTMAPNVSNFIPG